MIPVCPCGFEFRDGETYDTGLLRSLRQQVDLEEEQADQLAHFIEGDEHARVDWVCRTFSAGYPFVCSKDLVEDYLYSTNRAYGFTATVWCPRCGRLGMLHDIDADWQWLRPE